MKKKDSFLKFYLMQINLESVFDTQMASYDEAEKEWRRQHGEHRFSSWGVYRQAISWRFKRGGFPTFYVVSVEVRSIDALIRRAFLTKEEADNFCAKMQENISGAIIARIYTSKTGKIDDTAKEIEIVQVYEQR